MESICDDNTNEGSNVQIGTSKNWSKEASNIRRAENHTDDAENKRIDNDTAKDNNNIEGIELIAEGQNFEVDYANCHCEDQHTRSIEPEHSAVTS